MTDGPTTPFASFALDPLLVEAVTSLGFENATPIQAAAIPALLDGNDMIGRARTGSGKTAAFGLPLLEKVKQGGPARALVLTPTRELALQVSAALRTFAKRLEAVRIVTVYGGASYEPQLKALARGATVVVGTPGRVLDHIDRGTLSLGALDYFVLDEADEMLRMGFIDDVEKILSGAPPQRQIALFSATMPEPIRAVAQKHLREPVEISVEERALSVEHIEQKWIRVPPRFKADALVRVLRGISDGATLVFTRTRTTCSELAERLVAQGMDVDALHGALTQPARERVLARMRSRQLSTVIATDVAARGLDVDHITHVVNVDMPDSVETYVHRIGRTGRMGRVGTAISFVTPTEMHKLKQLERRLRVSIAELTVPSDADIMRTEQAQLRETLLDAARSESTAALDWLEALAASSGIDAHQLAGAAVKLLAARERVTLGAPPDEGAPMWARTTDRARGPRPVRERIEDEVFLFFPVGFSRGIKASDLVGMLANEANVPVARIGRITVLPHKSFVGLPKAEAERVLQVLPSTSLRGTVVPIRLAHDRPEDERRAPPPRPSKKHGRQGHGARPAGPRRPKPHLGKHGHKKP